MENYKLHIFGLILGVSVIASSGIIASTFISVRKLDNVISVSGSAKQKVTADNGRWTARFSRTAMKDGLTDGYQKMRADEKSVRELIAKAGFTQVDISPVLMNEVYKNDQNLPKEYTLAQDLEVRSDSPEKLRELAKNSEELISRGILFQSNPVEYYYSKLPELRVSLLPQAIKDARVRAETIANSSNLTVDTTRSVSMGVVQVLSAGSVDVSDYGSYDTSRMEKEVMITVKATFGLK